MRSFHREPLSLMLIRSLGEPLRVKETHPRVSALSGQCKTVPHQVCNNNRDCVDESDESVCESRDWLTSSTKDNSDRLRKGT